jgi:hypothetical protein
MSVKLAEEMRRNDGASLRGMHGAIDWTSLLVMTLLRSA